MFVLGVYHLQYISTRGVIIRTLQEIIKLGSGYVRLSKVIVRFSSALDCLYMGVKISLYKCDILESLTRAQFDHTSCCHLLHVVKISQVVYNLENFLFKAKF